MGGPSGTARRGRTARRSVLVVLAVVLVALVAVPGSSAQPEGREVRVAVRPLEPFVIKTTEGYTGFSIEVWEQIAERNDYRTTYVEVANVTEQLEAVTSGRADVAITAISITAERERMVDFSVPMFNAGLGIAVPASSARQTGGLWTTLTSRPVLAILIVMLLSVLVAALIVWLIERRDNPDFAHAGVKGISEGIWWAIVTMLTVGYGDRVTRTAAGRAFSMLFMLFGVLLVATFTATFTATLTISNLDSGIDGVDDLRGKQVVTLAGTTSATYLDGRGIPYDAVESVDQLVTRLEDGEADAAVYDTPVLTYQIKSGRDIALAGGPLTREYYGVATPTGSDLREPVDAGLLTTYQDGTYVRLLTEWFG